MYVYVYSHLLINHNFISDILFDTFYNNIIHLHVVLLFCPNNNSCLIVFESIHLKIKKI